MTMDKKTKKSFRVFLLVILSSCLSIPIQGQEQKQLDSLKKVFSTTLNDTFRIRTCLAIGNKHFFSNPDTSLLYYRKVIEMGDILSKKGKTPRIKEVAISVKSTALLYTGAIQYYRGNYNQAIEFYLKAVNAFEEINDKIGVCDAYVNVGTVYLQQGYYDKALDYYLKSVRVYEELGNKDGIADSYMNIGLVYYSQNNFSEARNNYLVSLKIYEEIGDKGSISNCYTNIGNSLFQQGFNIQASEYYLKALEIEKNLSRNTYLSICYINIANVFREQGQFEKAIEMYEKALAISEEIGDKSGMTNIYRNLITLNITMADSVAANNHQRINYLNKAISYGKNSIFLAKEMGSIELINSSAKELITVYTKLNNFPKALEFANLYIETRDSLFSAEKSKTIEELMIKYETEKKEREIQSQQVALGKAKFRLTLMFSAAGLFVLVISFLFYVLRLKQKTGKILESKNQQLQISNATKDKFFSIISHDLRSPVSGFRNLSSSIGRNFDAFTPEQIKENVINLSTAADETVNLLNNLLQWSKSQQNKIEVKKFPVKLNRLCGKVFDEAGIKLKEKNIALKADIPELVEVVADENIISTVLRNFLTNAIKFSPDNSALEVNTMELDGTVKVSVKDYGIGMSEEDMSKLFRMECDTKSIGCSPEKGSGLGLILCKELITLHGGNIQVESKLGEGSTFSFTIPKG